MNYKSSPAKRVVNLPRPEVVSLVGLSNESGEMIISCSVLIFTIKTGLPVLLIEPTTFHSTFIVFLFEDKNKHQSLIKKYMNKAHPFVKPR